MSYTGEIPDDSTDPLDPALADISPRSVAYFFDELRQIPRGSGNERQAMNFLHEWATEHGFECANDKVGNLCIKVPASKGCEGKPTVCLQGHIDMVCVKGSDVVHDFTKDPIKLRREGKLLKAQGTSLGADDGFGVAAALSVACDPTAIHPPMEILITVDEEDGLSGAKGLDPAALGMKSTSVLNLDNEEFGKVFTSSAGIREMRSQRTLDRDLSSSEGTYFEISVAKMTGGHSGADVHKYRGNAIIALGELLQDLPEGSRLVSMEGGQKMNAIPAEAKVVICVPDGIDQARVENAISNVASELEREWKAEVKVSPRTREEVKVGAVTAETHEKIVKAFELVPDGIAEMFEGVRGFVRTSSNLGVLRTDGDEMEFTYSVRSSSNEGMDRLRDRIAGVMAGAGFDSKTVLEMDGWDGDPKSTLARYADESYR